MVHKIWASLFFGIAFELDSRLELFLVPKTIFLASSHFLMEQNNRVNLRVTYGSIQYKHYKPQQSIVTMIAAAVERLTHTRDENGFPHHQASDQATW